MGRLNGRVAIVTGTSSGIGRATALRLAAEGAKVACLDVVEDVNEKTAGQIREAGGTASAQVCNVADRASVQSAVEAATAELGPCDVLCNIAGVGKFANSADQPIEEWDRIIGVNLTGTWNMCQAVLPSMLERNTGVILNTASTAGVMGQPFSAAYCASKGGVVMLTQALATEYIRKNIRVNAVAPGGIQTAIIKDFTQLPEGADYTLLSKITLPDDQWGEPEEVAGLFAFLASDEARYINGSIYKIDGGLTC
jgi:NAD(P)-dependent dehydrogenase (short-subunit alcohol dehydrogenase family)